MKKIILSVLLAFVTVQLHSRDFLCENDISYTRNNDAYSEERCRLDVYYPADTTRLPVVVWFHGGGLTGGNKYIPDELKDGSQVVVAVNYRLLPRVEISDCIDDAAAAVAWTFDSNCRTDSVQRPGYNSFCPSKANGDVGVTAFGRCVCSALSCQRRCCAIYNYYRRPR